VDLPSSLKNKPLTLIQLSDIALSCHPSTRLAWAQSKAAWASLGIAESVFWPQINGLASYSNNSIRSNNQTTHQNSSAAGISLNFLVWDFGVSLSKAKAAQLQWRAALFNQNYALQQVIFELEKTYYRLIGQKDVVISSQQSVKEAKANLDAATAMREQGLATIGDVYQAKSALLKAELILLQTEGTLKILEGQLLTNLGLSIKAPLKLAPVPDVLETKPILESTESFIAYATQNRPDLLAAKAQVESSSEQLLAAKRQVLPAIQLSTSTQYQNSGGALGNGLGTSGGSGSNGSGLFNGITLSLSVPIFTGFSNTYNIRQAEAQKEQAEAQYKLLNQQIDLQVWQSYFDLQTAAKSIESSRSLLESATQAAKQAHGQYESGVGDILTVLSTQSTASNARIQWIQAKLNWYTALAQLSASLGNTIRER
jgi:outer membrane protein TolC